MVTNTLLRIQFIKVINTQILIGLVIAQHKIDSHQQAVLNRADGALFPTPPRQTMILRFEIAVLRAHRRVRHLGQHRIEVTVALRRFTASPFAGSFPVARTVARPRSKVLVAWESTHVDPRLRQQRPRPTLADSRHRVELFYRGSKRGSRDHPQPLATRAISFSRSRTAQQLSQQKTVMLRQLSFQSSLQLGNLPAQLLWATSASSLTSFSPASALQSSFFPILPTHLWPPIPA